MYIKTIKKDYPKSTRILKFAYGFNLEPPMCTEHGQISCPQCWVRSSNPVPSPSSLQRTKTLMTDYTLCNEFDSFVTFTYDPKKVDRFDISEGKRKITKWLNNTKTNKLRSNYSPDLQYLVIPELHKDGAIHFHALFKNYLGLLDDSYKKVNGRPAYNLPDWDYGYSTLIKIDNIEKVSSYMQKYITKDMLKIGNKKRYFASRNLKKPTKTYNINMIEEVYTRPLFTLNQHTTYNTTTSHQTGEIIKEERFTIYRIVK